MDRVSLLCNNEPVIVISLCDCIYSLPSHSHTTLTLIPSIQIFLFGSLISPIEFENSHTVRFGSYSFVIYMAHSHLLWLQAPPSVPPPATTALARGVPPIIGLGLPPATGMLLYTAALASGAAVLASRAKNQ